MSLHDLPDDILRLILRQSLESRRTAAVGLKAKLRLLAVCQRWRYLALHMVHSAVSIEYYGETVSNRDSGAVGISREIQGGKVKSNLSLIVASGCAHTVKKMDINVNCVVTPLPGLCAVINLIRAAAEVWRSVRELDIFINPDSQILSRGWFNLQGYTDYIRQTSVVLAATMPGVRHVKLRGCSAGSIAQELYEQLPAFYAGQLQSLESWCPVTAPPGCTFTRLRRVYICYPDLTGHQHPRTDPARLISLTLRDWPARHSWAPFSTGGDSNTIVFPSLNDLDADYGDISAESNAGSPHWDGHPWELHFPRLKNLRVACFLTICPLLSYAVLPLHMDRVSIKATATSLLRAEEILPLTIKCLKLCISGGNGGNRAALAVANRILEGHPEVKIAELGIDDVLLPVQPEDITCTWLEKLTLHANTSVDMLLGLIRRLPRLVDMSLMSLTLGDIQEDIAMPGPSEIHMLEPLSTSIMRLSVWTGRNYQHQDMFESVTKCLLLRIPSLVKYETEKTQEKHIERLVSGYSKRCPHLSRMHFKF